MLGRECNVFGVQRVKIGAAELRLALPRKIGMELEIFVIALHPPQNSASMAPKALPAMQAPPSQTVARFISAESRQRLTAVDWLGQSPKQS